MKDIITVCPDVHGRVFWKDVRDSLKDNEEVIFLGDYVDPYAFDGITPEEAFERFKEIIAFKKEKPEQVTLLLGNHDLHYFLTGDTCRIDRDRKDEIAILFTDNISLFDIVAWRTVDGRDIMFSHSAMLRGWLTELNELIDTEFEWALRRNDVEKMRFFQPIITENSTPYMVCNRLNYLLHNDLDKLRVCLDMVAYTRGGGNNHGSIVWADVSEKEKEESKIEDGSIDGTYMVFGHTLQFTPENEKEFYSTRRITTPYGKIIKDKWACIDSGRAYRVSVEDNNVIVKEYGETEA